MTNTDRLVRLMAEYTICQANLDLQKQKVESEFSKYQRTSFSSDAAYKQAQTEAIDAARSADLILSKIRRILIEEEYNEM